MSGNETEESAVARLERRIDELERRVERTDRAAGTPRGPVGATADGRLVTNTRCLRCERGVLLTEGQRLVCSSCDYVRYL